MSFLIKLLANLFFWKNDFLPNLTPASYLKLQTRLANCLDILFEHIKKHIAEKLGRA